MSKLTYGKWLRDQRTVRGITQAELTEKAELAYGQASKYERGVLKLPMEDVRERIHAVLGTSEEDLVEAGVLHRLKAGGYSVLVPSSEADREHLTSHDPDDPSYGGEVMLDDVIGEITDAAKGVAWTQSMVDTIVKQIEMFQKIHTSKDVE